MALLRHARVYTLAQRFGVPALSQLAHKKIHLTNSTARGEIEYARYVYGQVLVSQVNATLEVVLALGLTCRCNATHVLALW